MLQTIEGRTVFVVDFDTMPELPITGEGEEDPYARALTDAILTGQITEPGKYGIEIDAGNSFFYRYDVYAINE